MFKNKFYLGIMNYAGEFYQGSHKTFVSKKLFDEVQKQIEKIERPRNKGHDFAFIGLATCGECGAAITAETHTKIYPKTRGEVEYIYYRCTKKLKPCNQKYINEQTLASQMSPSSCRCSAVSSLSISVAIVLVLGRFRFRIRRSICAVINEVSRSNSSVSMLSGGLWSSYSQLLSNFS